MSFKSFGQEYEKLLIDDQINIRVLFLTPYYEFGEDQLNHFGLSGGVSIYKGFFIGAYYQKGNKTSNQEENDFETEYSRGGFCLGRITPIKKSKFSIITSCYLGKGQSTSKQNTPISFTDAQIRFNVITPELGLEYRFIQIGTLMLSTGYHSYLKKDEDDQPVGFNGFTMNRFYTKLGFRIGF